MGHQNSKKHKASHAGYREKPTKAAIKANMELWAGFKNEKKEISLVDEFDELDVLFGDAKEPTPKLGIQFKLNL